MFYFHPYLGKWSNLTSIFFKRVVQSPTSFVWLFFQFLLCFLLQHWSHGFSLITEMHFRILRVGAIGAIGSRQPFSWSEVEALEGAQRTTDVQNEHRRRLHCQSGLRSSGPGMPTQTGLPCRVGTCSKCSYSSGCLDCDIEKVRTRATRTPERCLGYIELEPKWPLFLKVNPPKQGSFQAKQVSFGF